MPPPGFASHDRPETPNDLPAVQALEAAPLLACGKEVYKITVDKDDILDQLHSLNGQTHQRSNAVTRPRASEHSTYSLQSLSGSDSRYQARAVESGDLR